MSQMADSMRARYVVSGIDDGSNGSAGLGIARSIRLFEPNALIVGVGYSVVPSALHSEILDEMHCLPDWDEVRLDTWVAQLKDLASDSFLIPGLALEARLLARELPPSARLLTPDEHCVSRLGRPAERLSRLLDIPLPPSLDAHSVNEVSRFLRRREHGAWVRGELGGSQWVDRTPAALRAGQRIEATWGTRWYLEEHIPGQACSIAFAALDGELVDAVFMSTTEVANGGTTWSGEVTELSGALRDRLRTSLSELGWNGGGDVELIRTEGGELRLIAVKPTLPSWIYGAAAAGLNVVGSLISGSPARTESPSSAAFTRLVVESGTPSVGAGRLQRAGDSSPTGSRDRSATVPAFAKPRSVTEEPEVDHPRDDQATERLVEVLEKGSYETGGGSGSFAVDTSDFARRVARMRETLGPHTVIGYSVKTFPHPGLMTIAAASGLVAEATSQHELDAAVRAGFERRDAILNGPAKWWPTPTAAVCGVAFADSLDELRMLGDVGHRPFPLELKTVGVRLHPSFESRFGVEMDTADAIDQVAHQLTRTATLLDATWGIHFHHAEAIIGSAVWRREVERLARITRVLTDTIGSPPAVVDVGGGWHAEDFEDYCSSVAQARELFPSIRDGATRLVTEPGRVLTQYAGIRFATVLARRTDASECDVVVDIGDPEMSQAMTFDRPVAVLLDGRWTPLRRGTSRVLGRTCMESDVLLSNVDTTDLRIGTKIAIGSCGAYDYSMSYEFGRGSAHG
ncbi:hypothetical protein D7319_18240 [Streptomyces radicis]|uniref:Orn/DAP/Arg decarboxylase 2 N-terminal domain-containing protein n=2 Tax=Streptomyces radicis TaxID=1750517 RepID=A0A3A9W4C0_9ACTN|nr:hypothetical protein D7319_18240 [Streptomyces radicis]RKN18325.1 hypothetical protein D7318_22475 [Streptomyces radicis]